MASCRENEVVNGTEVAAILHTNFETAKVCREDPRDYLRRVVETDIRNPETVTMPRTIQAVLDELD